MTGISGDQVDIHDGYGDGYVLKFCNQTNPERFLRAAYKQQQFYSSHLQAVPIVQQGVYEGKHFIRMPYIEHDDSITLAVEDNLISYIKNTIGSSRLGSFNYYLWQDKILELQGKIQDPHINKILLQLDNIQFKQPFYYTLLYHGDMNFDNLLIKDGYIYAIDFLHSFIQSPIHDLNKLRQSVKFDWKGKKHKSLDEKLQNIIDADPILNEYIKPFDLLNLIRIIPYTQDKYTFDYLKDLICTL